MKKLALKEKSTSIHYSLLLTVWTNSSRKLNMVSFYLTELLSEVFLLSRCYHLSIRRASTPLRHAGLGWPQPGVHPCAVCWATVCLSLTGIKESVGYLNRCVLGAGAEHTLAGGTLKYTRQQQQQQQTSSKLDHRWKPLLPAEFTAAPPRSYQGTKACWLFKRRVSDVYHWNDCQNLSCKSSAKTALKP